MPSSSRSSKSSGSSHGRTAHRSVRQLIASLQARQYNTLSDLCRIERIAASCEREEDAQAFQGPMISAWNYYVESGQFMTELLGLTRNYPFCTDIIHEAHNRVKEDLASDRSWNLAWLILAKVQTDGLIPIYAASEALRPEMWGDHIPTQEEVDRLAATFELEWTRALSHMLRQWTSPPTWH